MKMIRKCISGFLAVLTVISLLPIHAFAEELPQDEAAVVREEEALHYSAEEPMSPEEQYEGHAYQAFYGETISTFGVSAGNRLSGIDKTLYDALVTVLRQIANGQRSSTVIRIGQDVTYQGVKYPADVDATFSESGFNLAVLHDALLGDLPFDLYWYDKVSGVRASRWTRAGELVQVEFYFSVADNYQGSEEYTTNTTKTSAASKAAANAKSIVAQYANATDYNKLLGYKNEIQARVTYDHDAADNDYFSTYIDPWQLISVFDGDSSTNVVCEGYSKAYMYLCDMSTFVDDITCYTVSGDLNGGGHMWNIVSIAGKNYLVDVTNSDTGSVGQNGGMFLNGVTGDPWNGYRTCGVLFTYDSDMFDLWGDGEDSILFVESTDFDPATAKVGTPAFTKLENTAEGIRLTWNPVVGAVKYRVFLKTSSGWETMGTTTGTSMLVTGLESGKSYTFTIRCMTYEETAFTSDYNTKGWTKTYVAQPAVTKFENTSEGIKLTWGAVPGVGKYRVYVQVDGTWKKLTDTTATSYTWTGAESGKTYIFTLRCVSADGQTALSSYHETGWSQKFIGQPKVTKLQNTAGGVKVTWGAVAGAVRYRVYAKTGDGGWVNLGSTTDTSFVHTAAKSGTTYTYTVRCVDASDTSFVSGFNTTGWKQKFIAQPKITRLANTAEGVEITWGEVAGAARYRVYVKNGDGWTNLGSTTATSFVWTGAKSGTTYTFTVRCVNADDSAFTSDFSLVGWDKTFVAQPKITKLAPTDKGMEITWGEVAGAVNYRVYVKSGETWKKLTDTTGTSFLWTGAKSGTTYAFTVRCITADGQGYISSYNDTGWKKLFVAQPQITKFQNVAEGIKVTWGAVTGAVNYRIYVKTPDGWKKLTDTTGTSYTWTGAKSGTTYAFTVRCITADGQGYTSSYNDNGWRTQFIAQPKITKLTNTAEGVKVTWGAVTGAARYRVYVKNSSGWTNLGSTTDTSFVYTGAESGKTYTFTVRCVDANDENFTSAFHETGWSKAFVAQPKITKFASTADGLKITWGKVAGAAKYRVYVKNADGGWTKLTDTTGSSYTWTDAKLGKTYTFTVRCITADGEGYTSSYSETGWKHKFAPVPGFSKLESANDGVKLTWKAINGAHTYRIYVKSGDTWKKLTDTTSTSYTWTGAQLGKTYSFTIRCLASDGVTYTTSYNDTGWSHKYYPTPSFSAMESTTSGVKLTWNAVNKAHTYRIYVKSGDTWKKLTDTTSTSYTWTGAETGTTYTFTIRCIDADGKTYTSNYNTTGWSHAFLAQPKISGFESLSTGMKITWGKVTGAEKYRIYVKTDSGWKKLADTTSTSYTWTGAKLGETYMFTVRCLNKAGTAFTSAANTTGWSATFSPAPEITAFESSSKGVKITWGAINGAENYRVFVKNSDGSWKTLGDATGTSYTWTGAKKGTTYVFTVRCVSADGKTFTSPYNSDGWSHKHTY